MSASRLLYTATPLAILAVAGMGLATAQSSSPFSSKKKTQAWETPVQTTPASRTTAPRTYAPQPSTSGQMPTYSSATPPRVMPQTAAPTYAPYSNPGVVAQAEPVQSAPPAVYNYAPPAAPTGSSAPDFGSAAPMAGGHPTASSIPKSPYARSTPSAQNWEAHHRGTAQGAAPTSSYGSAPRYGAPSQTRSPAPTSKPTPPYQQPAQSAPQHGYQPYGQTAGQPSYQSPYPPSGNPPSGQQGPTSYPSPQQPRSWKDRLGLGNLATAIRGKFNLGAAATYRDQPPNQLGPDDGWSEDFIGDAEIEGDVSAITQGGLEYGLSVGVRAQYDPYRRGFGGRLADCPPTVAGCSGLRGHSSGFYTVGDDTAKDFQVAVETAHVFLRSAYGDVTIGRDDGAAYIFSLGAPTLLAVNASNSPVDYTGYDSVKTVNDASGFAEKITYTSPRLLGDKIGVGVQLGGSYTLKADACGVDYCVDRDVAGLIRPEIEDVFEGGLALDRTFDNGLSVEGTFTYARGSEVSGLAGLDDLQSYGAGVELGYGDWTLGGSYLQSNNGLLDGDYTAYDAGVTWQPGALGFTLGYGHAKDDNVSLTSDQATFGVTYDFDKFTVGTGVQYVDRTSNGLVGGVLTPLDQTATSVFVQGGFKF